VVNELSDSVSVVSLAARAVVATLKTPDEPADVVFAQGRVFVSCARSNSIRVFNATDRSILATIPLQGMVPSALTANPAGTLVYAAFLHSGNNTTILPANLAPVQPAPTNPNLPAPPKTALIVPSSHPQVSWNVLDRDIAEIDAASMTVSRYIGGAGTNLLDVSVHPISGDIWVANTEARNLVRFEPALRGHIVDHRLTRVPFAGGIPSVHDLNPGIDYGILPNPTAQATALAHPNALVFRADGTEAWVAAFSSDRIAKIDPQTGAVVSRVDLRSAGQGSRQMRGPRALAWNQSQARLYVLNKLSNTISVVGTNSATVLAEIPAGSHDPMPANIREGRGFLFDARLSGNGTASCSSCHLDADRDGLAWDLGDPAGTMQTVTGANLVVHDPTPRNRTMHPMKGPMTTQSLRGMSGGAPFHWRGDKATLQDFNGTFETLLGGVQIPTADMNALAAYLLTLRNHPNPNLLRNGQPPATFAGGDPLRGAGLFTDHNNHCNECHSVPRGTNNNIDLHAEVGASQPIKNPSLRTTYQRMFFNPQPGAQSLSGFGLNHDGTGFALPTVHPYVLDELGSQSLNDFADVTAFVLCFPTETKPSVGDTFTVTAGNATAMNTEIAQMEAQTGSQSSDFVARGLVGGAVRSFFYNRTTQRYEPDSASEPTLTRAQLLAMLGANDALTFLGTPPGEGRRFGGDRDGDSIRDRDEAPPGLTVAPFSTNARLQWPATPAGWVLEATSSLVAPDWSPVTTARQNSSGTILLDEPASIVPARFYRLRRTW
jgi:YVTN family beta-propeller protein